MTLIFKTAFVESLHHWLNNMLHKNLQKEQWFKLSVCEQMANIGSEVIRAIKWKAKRNNDYAYLANTRALELFDMTLEDPKYASGVKELTRAREFWLDYFFGNNQYHQTDDEWIRYFLAFTYAARNNITKRQKILIK
ncbi:hypothetical protein A3D77_05295 [Candidatus Gottesmanbacteria bacterium RIFCSPHIGHO2_02_FULL_39_11]|uniref:Uncharacterized protein n=1 Tax=Candidatus Gottesmanbacteria bacterium RIFCSPHIGHO2_02_FULL_39_11 TaxID=1798382 RepID=A0A1F5ZLA3_9BACT|nr:MAG: hypothetical protein A3D77_05295 [Candidatus Gottesmanbacteria bacterium RIFCSPHIGHO2_02_FULL_39_11]